MVPATYEYSLRELRILNRKVFGHEVESRVVMSLYNKVRANADEARFYPAGVAYIENGYGRRLTDEEVTKIASRLLKKTGRDDDQLGVRYTEALPRLRRCCPFRPYPLYRNLK